MRQKTTRAPWLFAAFGALALVACSKSEAPAAEVAAAPAPTAAAEQKAASPPNACTLITAAEMSKIVGTSLESEADESGSSTTCRYRPASNAHGVIEVTVNWGSGEAAMMGLGIFGRMEPNAVDPLRGVGDKAIAIGPQLMIRTGDDLVTLTFAGVKRPEDAPRRIIETMRPRMGPSTEVTFPPARGPATKIPLIPEMRIIASRHEPGRGDYEPIVSVATVTKDEVEINYSASLPEGDRISIKRIVRRSDLERARGLRSWFQEGDPEVFEGTTAFGLSIETMRQLKEKGRAEFVRFAPATGLGGLAKLLGGLDKELAGLDRLEGTLTRVEPHAVAVPILLNDQPVDVAAIHARGVFGEETIDYYILDDPDNPIVLRSVGRSTGRVVRISFPVDNSLERKLETEERVELHGIYFDFNKATLRPESEPVLREIAAVMKKHPGWKIGIEGHTDNIGGNDFNLDLSRRRSAAVRQALVERYGITSDRMTPEGFGASRPRESNNSVLGRARNRRVELVRH